MDTDSLHLTLSTGRQHTWRDLLQFAMDGALEDASAAHPEWRRSLPHNYLNYMGVIHADTAEPQRAAFHTKLHGTMRPAVTLGVGGCNRTRPTCNRVRPACNPMCPRHDEHRALEPAARRCMRPVHRTPPHVRAHSVSIAALPPCVRPPAARVHPLRVALTITRTITLTTAPTAAPTRYDRLPPRLSRADAAHVPADEAAVDAISLGSRVRLVSRHAARLAVEGDLAVLYYYTLNPRVLNAQPEHDRAQHIDFSLDAAPCLEKLLLAYPKYVTVGKLPADNDAQRLDVVQATPHTYCGDTY